jgi:hypothetical protein
MILTKIKGQRMWGGTTSNGSSSSGGSGGSGGGGGTVDFATNAEHANSAGKLDANSSDWNKIANKTIAQTIAEVWTFAKGIVSTLKSYFNGGIEVEGGIKVTGGIDTDVIETSGDVSVGGNLEVDGDLTGHDADFEDVSMGTLNVRKEAHFTKLVIDELLSNKGAIIISSANCTAEVVVPSSQQSPISYDIYFSAVDRDGNAVQNPWLVNDQAICMTFDGLSSGSFSNVANRYYWRLVTGVESNVTYAGNTYHKITLSNAGTAYDGSTVPKAGDDIMQLGYRGSSNAYRKSAIILSSYPTMDTGVTPPALVFYKGINDFDLVSHRYTYIDGLSNEFIGNFRILVGSSYENLTTILATIEGLISTVQKEVRGKNILPLDGWTDINGNLLDSDNYEQSTQRYTNSDGSGGYADMLYSPIFWLKAGTYCFSCYPSRSDAELYLYSSSERPVTPNSMTPDPVGVISGIASGSYSPAGSGQTYGRRYLTFTLDNDCYVSLNPYLDDNFFVMCRPQLETGDEPTEWESGSVLQVSVIKQTADKIEMRVDGSIDQNGNLNSSAISIVQDQISAMVGQVGINIDEEQIELNGKTVVNGAMTLNSGDNGFVLQGSNDQKTKITSESIGTYDNFSALSQVDVSLSITALVSNRSGNDVSGSTMLNLGSVRNTGYALIQNGDLYIRKPNSGDTPIQVNNYSIGVIVYVNNSQVASGTITSSSPVFNFNTGGTGTLTIKLTFSGTAASTPSASDTYQFTDQFTYSSPSNGFMQIGYDGLAVNFSSLKTCYIGANETRFRYGNYALRISSSGIEKSSNAGATNPTWTPI